MNALALFVSVPVTSFRVPHAREYFETLSIPPPSTVYGMLLSLVGEPDRLRHLGAEIAVALLSSPERSVVLRTMWRVKNRKLTPGKGENKRPDFQELLTNVQLGVWVRPGAGEVESPALADRVEDALSRPGAVHRFGGLSLGESAHLVDEVRELRDSDLVSAFLLVRDEGGDLALPVWADHVGSVGTRWQQYRLIRTNIDSGPVDSAWTAVLRPERGA